MRLLRTIQVALLATIVTLAMASCTFVHKDADDNGDHARVTIEAED